MGLIATKRERLIMSDLCKLCGDMCKDGLECMASQLKSQARDLASKQARIDELMLEFCEDEMTEDQMDNWESHQRVVKHKGPDQSP